MESIFQLLESESALWSALTIRRRDKWPVWLPSFSALVASTVTLRNTDILGISWASLPKDDGLPGVSGINGRRVPATPSISTLPADTSDIRMKSSGISRHQPVCQLDSKSWVSIANPQRSRDEPPPMNTIHVSNLQNHEQTKHSKTTRFWICDVKTYDWDTSHLTY